MNKLSEENYQIIKAIQYKSKFGRPLVYPPPVELYSDLSLHCRDCGNIYGMEVNIDTAGNKHIYMECDGCGRLEYISPERKKFLDEAIKNIKR